MSVKGEKLTDFLEERQEAINFGQSVQQITPAHAKIQPLLIKLKINSNI